MSGKQENWEVPGAPPRKTTSGRTVIPTRKVRELMSAKVESFFWRNVRAIDRYGQVLSEAIITCTDPSAFKDILVEWLATYNGVIDAEHEMKRYLDPDRYVNLVPDIAGVHKRCSVLKRRAYEHLDSLSLNYEELRTRSYVNASSRTKSRLAIPKSPGLSPYSLRKPKSPTTGNLSGDKGKEGNFSPSVIADTPPGGRTPKKRYDRVHSPNGSRISTVSAHSGGSPKHSFHSDETKTLNISREEWEVVSKQVSDLQKQVRTLEHELSAMSLNRRGKSAAHLSPSKLTNIILDDAQTRTQAEAKMTTSTPLDNSHKLKRKIRRLKKEEIPPTTIPDSVPMDYLNSPSKYKENIFIPPTSNSGNIMRGDVVGHAVQNNYNPETQEAYYVHPPSDNRQYYGEHYVAEKGGIQPSNIPCVKHGQVNTVYPPFSDPKMYHAEDMDTQRFAQHHRAQNSQLPPEPTRAVSPDGQFYAAPGTYFPTSNSTVPVYSTRTTTAYVPSSTTPVYATAPFQRIPSPVRSSPQALDPAMAVLDKLADVLMYQQQSQNSHYKAHKLPLVEPNVFDGKDVLTFPTWMNSFTAIIEKDIEDPLDRLFYLSKYTSKDAKKAIEDLLCLHSDKTAYDKAKAKLHERFGNQFLRAEAFRNKLKNWPKLSSGDSKGLLSFADFLQHCCSAMGTLHYLKSLDDPEENVRIVEKLPSEVATRWNRKVVTSLYYQEDGSAIYPSFKDFCDFIQIEARMLSGPCFPKTSKEKKNVTMNTSVERLSDSNLSKSSGNGTRSKKFNSASQNSNGSASNDKIVCHLCKGQHFLDKCKKFTDMTVEERRDYVRQEILCFGCLKPSHDFRKCKHRNNSLLRLPKNNVTDGAVVSSAPTVNSTSSSIPVQSHDTLSASSKGTSSTNTQVDTAKVVSHRIVTLPTSDTHFSSIVPVRIAHINKPSHNFLVYALLDSQSDGCFITESIAEKLRLHGNDVNLDLTTMDGTCSTSSKAYEGLIVQGIQCNDTYTIPCCYSRSLIPANRKSIPRPDTVRQWSHLKKVADFMMPYSENVPVGILLGYNCVAGSEQFDTVNGPTGSPWGTLTRLGWYVSGPITPSSSDSVPYASSCLLSTAEITSDTIRQVFDQDFSGVETGTKMSCDDVEFMRKMDEGFRLDEDGHVELPLPIRDGAEIPPGFRKLAFRRAMSQKKRLLSDSVYCQRYKDFIFNMIAERHAELAPPLSPDDVLVCYLPHTGIYHPHKPDQLRVVFDGSAEVDGISLNSLLLQGPDLTNNMLGVLLRFREELFAFQCDIKGMFHQVRVTPKFRNLLRFFYFQDGDPNKPLVEYRMCVHLFGATSSPACATYALQKIAKTLEKEFGYDVVDFILRFFYVDDGLRSVSTIDSALNIIHKAIAMCQKGGFLLHKFASNSEAILRSLSREMLAKNFQSWQPGEPLPDQMALGTHWDLNTDTLKFMIKLIQYAPTRRGLLSALGSIYDPLGLVSPVVLFGRRILQNLCKRKFTWDQIIDSEIEEVWSHWYQDLLTLNSIAIPRCYRRSAEDVSVAELHLFGDASDDGHGACAYLVLEDHEGLRDVTLAAAKSRVMPVKKTTVPRAELQAAVLAVKMKEFLVSELSYDNIVVFFYTDSTIILAYINNTSKKLSIYVLNRVQFIRDHSSSDQWRHVSTSINPADLLSRGCSATELVHNDLHWNGPRFLHQPDVYVPSLVSLEIPDNDPEIRVEKTVMTTQVKDNILISGLSTISEWCRVVHTVVLLRKFLRLAYSKKKGIELPCSSPVQERMKSIYTIVHHLQDSYYNKTLNSLKPGYPVSNLQCRDRNRSLKQEGSNVQKLDVYLCPDDDVLKVGGRLKRANLVSLENHPAILPKFHPLTKSLVRFYHSCSAHSGRNSTINLIRQSGWWIPHIRSVVSAVIHGCVQCKRLRAKPESQKMADLPTDRLENVPPFTYCAVDFFGPFYIKERRSVLKRWGCLFSCLILRAVHLEICPNMTTDCFLSAFRRFNNRRGPVRSLRCDRGTNIMGAKAELDLNYAKMSQDKIKARMLQSNCDWLNLVPNVPHASHMGGAWERLIGSVRRSFEALLADHAQILDDDGLRTLMTESENIVNNRPITFLDVSDPTEPVPITPASILTMKTKKVLPPLSTFIPQDKYSRYMWRRVQYLSDQFWHRWVREYLPILQERSKWLSARRNLAPGDIVLIVEDNVARSDWPIARVSEVYKSADGLVRTLKVLTKNGSYDRPIHKVVLLYRPGTNLGPC